MTKYTTIPETVPQPVAMPVMECNDCGLAVVWPNGVNLIPQLRCSHRLPTSTRKTWARALVTPA